MIKPHSKFFFINHQITPISEYLDAFATQTYSPPHYISLLHGLVSVCFLATQLSIRATGAWICRQEILLFLVMLILMNINFPLLSSRLLLEEGVLTTGYVVAKSLYVVVKSY
jgi:hypothetical protein